MNHDQDTERGSAATLKAWLRDFPDDSRDGQRLAVAAREAFEEINRQRDAWALRRLLGPKNNAPRGATFASVESAVKRLSQQLAKLDSTVKDMELEIESDRGDELLDRFRGGDSVHVRLIRALNEYSNLLAEVGPDSRRFTEMANIASTGRRPNFEERELAMLAVVAWCWKHGELPSLDKPVSGPRPSSPFGQFAAQLFESSGLYPSGVYTACDWAITRVNETLERQ